MEKPSAFYDSEGPPKKVCLRNDRNVGSLGVWVGDSPFEFLVPVTLCQIVVIGVISQGLFCVLRPLKTPRFLCSILAGILLGPSFLGNRKFLETLFPWKQASYLLTLSKIGVVYFVFITTMKMDIISTLRGARRCWLFGVVPFLSSYIVTAALLAFYDPDDEADKSKHVVPNVFTLSSFAVVAQALLELNLVTTELGKIALSSALIGEIMQWTSVAIQFNNIGELNYKAEYIVSISAFVSFCVFVIRPMMKMIALRTPMGQPLKETYVVMILLGALISAGISDYIGIPFIIGPTIYGLVIPSGPPLATTVAEKSEVIIFQILMPSFFSYIGINTNFTKIENWNRVIIFQCILFAGFLVKVITCVLLSPVYHIKPKHGMALGLILSIKGIIELLYFIRLRNNGTIDGQVLSQMVLYVIVTTSICAPLIKALYKRHPRVLKTPNMVEGQVIRTIQNTSGNTEFNIVSCLHNDGNVHSMIALLEACNPSIESPMCVHVIHLIDLSGKLTPVLLPMNKQNRKSLSINYPNTNSIFRAFENYSKNSSGPVTILSYVCFQQEHCDWFGKYLKRKIGDGRSVSFWYDIWIEQTKLELRFRRLHNLSNQKLSSIFELGQWLNGQWVWNFSWRRPLLDREMIWVEDLKEVLGNVALKENMQDSWVWEAVDSGCYTVKSGYQVLQQLELEEPLEIFKNLWKVPAPSNVSAFVWRAMLGRIQTRKNLSSRNIIQGGHEVNCPMCNLNEESVEHLLLSCNFAVIVWKLCYKWLGLTVVLPNNMEMHFQQHSAGNWNRKQRWCLWSIWFATLWVVWLERNKVVFKNAHPCAVKAFQNVQLRSWNWLKAKVDGFCFSFYDWYTNPSYCLSTVS